MRGISLLAILTSALLSPQSKAFQGFSTWAHRKSFFVISYYAYTPGITYNVSGSGFTSIADANQQCLNDLSNAANNWKGKTEAVLNASTVSAFLCDNVNCNNLKANRRYYFATSGYPLYGGATFITDATGAGPNDSGNWSDTAHFGANWSYWLGRTSTSNTAWGLNPSLTSCTGWTTTSGKADTASASSTTSTRWSGSQTNCNNTGTALICIVEPPQ